MHGDGAPEQLRDPKDWGQYRSWAELVAGEGLIGIAFNHRSTHDGVQLAEAANEVSQAVAFAVKHADELHLDASHLCVWTCSAGAPLVLPALLHAPPPSLRWLVCFYGLTRITRGGPDRELGRARRRRDLGPIGVFAGWRACVRLAV
ncbi:MAG: hypothetical protein ACRDNJ_10150 [Solirubrobacteraceae bacterium]